MPRSPLFYTIVVLAAVCALQVLLRRRLSHQAPPSNQATRVGRLLALEPALLAGLLALVALVAWFVSK
jgi:hypothetical protein